MFHLNVKVINFSIYIKISYLVIKTSLTLPFLAFEFIEISLFWSRLFSQPTFLSFKRRGKKTRSKKISNPLKFHAFPLFHFSPPFRCRCRFTRVSRIRCLSTVRLNSHRWGKFTWKSSFFSCCSEFLMCREDIDVNASISDVGLKSSACATTMMMVDALHESLSTA